MTKQTSFPSVSVCSRVCIGPDHSGDQSHQRAVGGQPYASPVNLSHSSFLRTMQEIFGVGPLLGDAANANDLSDLFKPGRLHETPVGR